MTLKELIVNTIEDDILTSIIAYYNPSENCLEGYRALLDSLKTREALATQCQIAIDHVTDSDGEEYEHVYGIVHGDEQTYCIGMCQREEWLGMAITPSTLDHYAQADIIAHCLYEMSFFGFRDEDLAILKKQLDESQDEDLG